jgi:hypothetical protein
MLLSGQIKDFHNSGFPAISDPLIDERELTRLRDIYDRMFDERVGRADGNQFDLAGTDEDDRPALLSQILHPQNYYPELYGA